MRTIESYKNISNSYVLKNQNWECVKNGKYQNLKTKINELENISTLPDYQKKYPIVWIKGDKIIAEVQHNYYQHETEEGEKLHGYCLTNYFKSNNVPQSEFIKIVNGEHPRNLGYNLEPIF